MCSNINENLNFFLCYIWSISIADGAIKTEVSGIKDKIILF